MFGGVPSGPPARRHPGVADVRDDAGEPAAPRAPRPAGRSLAELDHELERRLTERGIVVRGHDVARVVGLSVGRNVAWTA
jgi:hypothetical protein